MSNQDVVRWNPHYTDACNMVTGEIYCHFEGGEKWLTKHGLLLDYGNESILRHVSCAEAFLTQLSQGKIELNKQVRYLSTLDELYQEIRKDYSIFHTLASLFQEALQGLIKVADDVIEEADSYSKEPIEERFGPAGDWGLITETLHMARDAAVGGMFKEFARQYARKEGFLGDLYGDCSIELSNPQDSEIAKHLSGTFQYFDHDQAYITEITTNRWRLNFLKLIPMPNRLMLEKAALDAASTIIRQGLLIDAEVQYTLGN